MLNLPREMRFREEYMFLIGMLPGGREGKQDLNKLLAPIVDELLHLFAGCTFLTHSTPSGVLVTAMSSSGL